MVFNSYRARFGVFRRETYVLIYFFDFEKSGVRSAVGEYHAVDAEIFVVSVAGGAVVAAVAPVCASVLVGGLEALVYPVPYESALHVGS